jgi:hypothetical protein
MWLYARPRAIISLDLEMVPIFILTKNEERNITGCPKAVRWSDDVQVLDSYSKDGDRSPVWKGHGDTRT